MWLRGPNQLLEGLIKTDCSRKERHTMVEGMRPSPKYYKMDDLLGGRSYEQSTSEEKICSICTCCLLNLKIRQSQCISLQEISLIPVLEDHFFRLRHMGGVKGAALIFVMFRHFTALQHVNKRLQICNQKVHVGLKNIIPFVALYSHS